MVRLFISKYFLQLGLAPCFFLNVLELMVFVITILKGGAVDIVGLVVQN